MSVELIPAELAFKRPFTQEVAQNLRLHNGNADEVAFKVKTTAPKQYCVRPNSGRILPGASVEVQVLLQAMKEDPAPDARCRDKFLVQSVAIPADSESENISQIWANIEQASLKSSVSEKKIRVSWLPAESTLGASLNGTTHASPSDAPPSYSPPSPLAVTPQRHSAGLAATDKSPGDLYSSTIDSPPADHSRSALSSATAAIASVTGQSQEEVNRQLADAKAKIAQLQAQLTEQTGLRQRKTGAASSDKDASSTTTLQQTAAPAGVPVQYVFLLCLLSFLIAYLLF